MVEARDGAVLKEVSERIAHRMGLYFPPERYSDLSRHLSAAGKELGFRGAEGCLGWLQSRTLNTRQIEALASHLTVGETYFLREPASFEALEREILPRLVAERASVGRTLRLWSAGCSSGEEAYSLAISCIRAVPDIRSWNVSVLATDINPNALAKAEAGMYSQWSFRGAPGWLRERFFSQLGGGKVAIDSEVKRLVHFDYLNLAEDIYPSLHNHTNAMDVIFCRNVLMYFTPEHQRGVAAALHRCLAHGGYLAVNPAEASTDLFSTFSATNTGGVVLYRKLSEAQQEPSIPPVQSPLFASEAPVNEPAIRAEPAMAGPAAGSGPPGTVEASEPEGAEALLARSADLANRGRLEDALLSCRGAIAAERANPMPRFLCATILLELGRLEEASGVLREVLYLDQDFILAHHALGGIFRRLGRRKEAARHFAIALRLLSGRDRSALVPHSDGVTCGRLRESIRNVGDR